MILSRYHYRPVTVPLPLHHYRDRTLLNRYQRFQRYQRYIYFLTTEYKIPSNKIYVTSVTLVTFGNVGNVRSRW
jgi:hypothetical protein